MDMSKFDAAPIAAIFREIFPQRPCVRGTLWPRRRRGPAPAAGTGPRGGALPREAEPQASFFSFSNERRGGSLFRMTPSVILHSFTPSR
jgi:hypothetical protein